jgi:beta-lactamase regulating signal transducer with metallopeptidase domain
MTFAPTLVVGWLQFAAAAMLLLGLAAALLRRIHQPADRRTLTQVACAAGVFALPWLALGAGFAWRVELLPQVAPSDVSTIQFATASGSSLAANSSPRDERFADGLRGAGSSTNVERTLHANSAVSHDAQVAASSGLINAYIAHARRFWQSERDAGRLGWSLAALTILAAHAAIALWFVIRRLQGVVQWRRLVRDAAAASDEVRAVWSSVVGARGQAARLLVSNRIDSPLLCGWRNPIVLVPRELAERGGLALKSCLAHEGAHVAQGDYLAWRCMDAAQLVLWMIPAYWTLRRELRISQDMLADHAAVRATGDAIEYSALLVNFARQRLIATPVGSLAFLDQPSQLTRRVKLLLSSSCEVRSTGSLRFAGLAAALALILMLLAGAVRIDSISQRQAVAEQPARESAKEPAKQAAKYRCRVIDTSTKAGIAGAKVTVRRSINRSDEHRLLLGTTHTTDADGFYELEIPAEQIDERSLYVELDVEHPEYPSKRGFGYSYAMIRKNEKLGERPFYELTELHPGAAVTGRLLDPNGKPLADVKVSGFSMSAGDFNSAAWAAGRTDQDGKFRVVLHREAEAVLWLVPKDFGPVEKYLAKRRGDQGDIMAPIGRRLKGQVVGVDGKPVAGAPVNIAFAGEREAESIPVVSSLRRGAISDAEGHFEFDALPPATTDSASMII